MPKPKLPQDVWAVVFLIHVRTPHRHIAKMFVTDVPDNIGEPDLKRALTPAGYAFGEFNTPWANHYLACLADAEDEVIGAWRRGDVNAVPWAGLSDEG